MSTVVLPGSFDPFTLGHLDLARRAAALADTVIIAVSHNPSKVGLLGLEARQEAIVRATAKAGLSAQIQVRALPKGLLVDFCREVGARAVVRGLRSQLDLAYEEPMARMNQHLAGVDTLFLLTDASFSHISSSLVREVRALGGDVSDMLPAASLALLAEQAAAPDVS
ncbi:pantetheine-phosphate adenylyltransferase [Brachybacterium sp. DNPG3]